MKAKLSKIGSLSASLSKVNSISARLSNLNQISATIHDDDIYDASYDIEVGFDDIVMNTKNKFMTDDIVIKKIPVSIASNDSGGYTLNIGG